MSENISFEVNVNTKANLYELTVIFSSIEEITQFINDKLVTTNPIAVTSVKPNFFPEVESGQEIKAKKSSTHPTSSTKRTRNEDILKPVMTINSLKETDSMMAQKVSEIVSDKSSPISSTYSNFSNLKA